ncbi:hypothetical protein [Pseudobacillus wudalianchiensis]|uniref:Uncharacterized protein n=1 Tax=Pseudobacillus wudalianchiensis TaxID=1743143 RepID=A0A1B9AGD6_9BACI|nr:hypothetical protein [Bacillus wudalianchiensis]OCA82900.1 hypothetical protein A8F95_14335 [Bacillus wudalianchiensis]
MFFQKSISCIGHQRVLYTIWMVVNIEALGVYMELFDSAATDLYDVFLLDGRQVGRFQIRYHLF